REPAAALTLSSGCLQKMLPGQPAPLVLGAIAPRRDAQERIVRLVVIGGREVSLVGGNDRQRLGVSELDEHGLGLDLVLEAMALQLDVEAITEDLLQGLQPRQGHLLVSFAQGRIDRPIGTTRQYDQALTMLLEPPDLEVGRLLICGAPET